MPRKVKICLIASLTKNRAIGYKNKLLWHIPADLAYFKKITSGHPVIMGQKTFESIGKPLPNRSNIIITNDVSYRADGCQICHSVDSALEKAAQKEDNEIFIIGGGSVYAQTIAKADKLYLTIVDGEYEADTFFPEYDNFKKIISEEKGESNGYKFTFLELER